MVGMDSRGYSGGSGKPPSVVGRFGLLLRWYTAGKGTRDVGVAQTLRFDGPGAHGSKDFSFPLPDGPYSFSGKLISLIWAMELTVSPSSETIRREITFSPTGREIILGERR